MNEQKQRRRVEDLEKDFITCREHASERIEFLTAEILEHHKHVADLHAIVHETNQTVRDMKDIVENMKDIIEAWNTFKGFSKGMTLLGKFASLTGRILWPIIAAAGTIALFIKTGHWQWPGDDK